MKNTVEQYDEQAAACRALMLRKNADYGDSWRKYRVTTLTDHIAAKIDRIKVLEDLQRNGGEQRVVGESIRDNLMDIVNYGLFELVMLSEQQEAAST